MILSVDETDFSLTQGFGPPILEFPGYLLNPSLSPPVYGPGLKRLPYLYPQNHEITTPLEKMIYQVITAVYVSLGTKGWSIVAAWGDLNPALGARSGDASELIEKDGVCLLDPERLAGFGIS